MAETLSADEKIALIKEQLHEVLKPEIIEDVIKKQNRPLVIYWGTPTRSPCLLLSEFVCRHSNDRSTTLRLLRAHDQNRSFPQSWL